MDSDRDDGDQVVDALRPDGRPASIAVPPRPTTPAPGGRRLVPFALLGVLTVGAGLGAYFGTSGNSTPTAAVASAVTNTLQRKSAAATTTVDITGPGVTATVTAKGLVQFDTGTTVQNLQIASGPEHIGERVISVGGNTYVHLDGGLIARIAAGKSWVSVPSAQSSANDVTGSSGLSTNAETLRVLSADGNDVSDLGSSQVNGQKVHLYAVHLTRAQIKRDLARAQLPSFMRQDIAQVQIPAITYSLAINGANELAQMRADLHIEADGQKIDEQITEYYSRYGAKVSVSAPPASEVISYEAFLQKALDKGVNPVV